MGRADPRQAQLIGRSRKARKLWGKQLEAQLKKLTKRSASVGNLPTRVASAAGIPSSPVEPLLASAQLAESRKAARTATRAKA
ncbi:hypothetical protein NliqN6_6170 [Naganishia liquefaciens]|uniref:Uncharacterized protein n=1 Tax=Naganishia liquefaciens TaxID=104408 RepID=A0A8H3YHW4_9TREE|nr:hypothetical protein NliqN6_6170 [Naganishia liquefaciens]